MGQFPERSSRHYTYMTKNICWKNQDMRIQCWRNAKEFSNRHSLYRNTDSFQEDDLNTLIMLTPLSDDNMIEPRIQIISGYVAWRFCQMAERTQWFKAMDLSMLVLLIATRNYVWHEFLVAGNQGDCVNSWAGWIGISTYDEESERHRKLSFKLCNRQNIRTSTTNNSTCIAIWNYRRVPQQISHSNC